MMNDTRHYFAVLLRRWWIVLAMPLLAMLAAALVTLTLPPTYEATAVIALAPATLSLPTANQLPPYYLMVDSPRHLPTAYTPAYYIALLKGAEVASPAPTRASVTIAPNGNDRSLFEITARAADPKIAADAANKWAEAGARRIQQVLLPGGEDVAAARQKLDAAEQALAQFSQDNRLGDYDPGIPPDAAGLPLAKKLELMQLLRDRDVADSVYRDFAHDYVRAAILAHSTYTPRLITAPVPTAPVAPKLAQNVLVGAAFGLLVGIAGAFAVERMKDEGGGRERSPQRSRSP